MNFMTICQAVLTLLQYMYTYIYMCIYIYIYIYIHTHTHTHIQTEGVILTGTPQACRCTQKGVTKKQWQQILSSYSGHVQL